MEETLIAEASKLLLPLVATSLLGLLKWTYPKLRDRIPNVAWPFALYGLSRAGTAACAGLDLACKGNPFNWSPETVNAISVTLTALVLREAVKSARNAPELLAKAKALLAKLRSP